MAALQKIRNHGVLLVTIIAIALALFVLGDLFRGGEGLINQSKQQVGEVLGEKLSIQEFNEMVNDIQNCYEIMGQNKSGEEVQNQIKDEAWQNFLQKKLVLKECNALGITVTDEEVAEVIQKGTSQLLQIPAFMNPQTNSYDYSAVQTFLSSYQKAKEAGSQVPDEYEKFYKYYLFAQRNIRDQLLISKYQSLLHASTITNSAVAKLSFDSKNINTILIASVPYSSIDDSKIKISDADINAKYNSYKEQFHVYAESRDIKYISVPVVPSDADKAASKADIEKAYKSLSEAKTNEEAGNVVRQSVSLVGYADILRRKEAYPSVISSELDSVDENGMHKPESEVGISYYYTFRVLNKAIQADSVLYRMIAAQDEKVADSILTALNEGADFKEIAQKYNQTGDSTWIDTEKYDNLGYPIDAETVKFINTIYGTGIGQRQKMSAANGNFAIIEVLDQKNPITKYNVACVLKEGHFSDETYNNEYSKFSSFLAANKTLADIEKNASKSGYSVQQASDILAENHNIMNIHSSHDALKWLFDEAKPNDVSQLYECGDNDHLLMVALTGVNKIGYREVGKVKDMLTSEVMNDKKAEEIMAKLKNAKALDETKSFKGSSIDTLKSVAFNITPYVIATSSQEPAVGGAASKLDLGKISKAIKGTRGVYMVQILDKKPAPGTFDAKAEKNQIQNTAFRYISNSLYRTLFLKGEVTDNRYKFM